MGNSMVIPPNATKRGKLKYSQAEIGHMLSDGTVVTSSSSQKSKVHHLSSIISIIYSPHHPTLSHITSSSNVLMGQGYRYRRGIRKCMVSFRPAKSFRTLLHRNQSRLPHYCHGHFRRKHRHNRMANRYRCHPL